MASPSAFLLSDTSVSGHPGCVTVMAVIRRQLESRGIRIGGTWPVALDWKYGLDYLPSLRNASVVVVNGEGTIHHTRDRWAARQLAQSARRLKLKADRKVYLINATIESIEPEDTESLRFFDHIFVRESSSLKLLGELGITSVSLVPDLSLTSGYQSPQRGQTEYVTDSVLPSVTTLLREHGSSTGKTYLPMQPSRPLSYLRWAVNRTALQSGATQYYETIAAARSLITGRFHAALFCLHAETPFLAVASNTSKIQSALKDAIGSTGRIISPEALKPRALEVPPFSGDELGNLRSYLSNARERAAAMFDQITQDL